MTVNDLVFKVIAAPVLSGKGINGDVTVPEKCSMQLNGKLQVEFEVMADVEVAGPLINVIKSGGVGEYSLYGEVPVTDEGDYWSQGNFLEIGPLRFSRLLRAVVFQLS